MKDQYNVLHGIPTIHPAAQTTSITGSGVDLLHYQGATIFVPVGAYTSYKHVCALYECATAAGSYTDVADADILGTEPTISGVSNTLYTFGYKGGKRFVKLNTTGTGSGSGVIFGALIVRGLKRLETGQ
jgi:hypothetical protein